MDTKLDESELRVMAERGAGQVASHASAREVLEWTDATFASANVVASSMQDAVLVHLAANARRSGSVPVLFLDAGYQFAETIGTRDAVAAMYTVDLENPLTAEGYPSIGCAPCTQRPEPGSDARSGRWAGRAKTECGLHTADGRPAG